MNHRRVRARARNARRGLGRGDLAPLAVLMLAVSACASGGAGAAPRRAPLASWEPVIAAELGRAEHGAQVAGEEVRVSGSTIGVSARARPISWLEFRGRTLGGSLAGGGPGADRDLASAEAEAVMALWPWFSATVAAEARSYKGVLATQQWRILRTGAEVRFPVANGGATGLIRGSVAPALEVEGLGQPTLALNGAAGVEIRHGWLFGALLYGIERFDFPEEQGFARREQLSLLSIQAGISWR